MRDYMDDERDRKMDEMYRSRDGGGFDDLWEVVVYIGIGLVVVLGAAGWLDHQFGWGLMDWFLGLLGQWTNGVIGPAPK